MVNLQSMEQCSTSDYQTAVVLEMGMIGEDCHLKKQLFGEHIEAKPGEIVVFARRTTFWDMFRRMP
jgi:hypothetical protein